MPLGNAAPPHRLHPAWAPWPLLHPLSCVLLISISKHGHQTARQCITTCLPAHHDSPHIPVALGTPAQILHKLLKASSFVCWQVEQRQLREGAAAMAAELVSLRQHMAYLTSSPGVPNGMPAGRASPTGMASAAHLPADSADLLSAATSGSLGITQVLVLYCTQSRLYILNCMSENLSDGRNVHETKSHQQATQGCNCGECDRCLSVMMCACDDLACDLSSASSLAAAACSLTCRPCFCMHEDFTCLESVTGSLPLLYALVQVDISAMKRTPTARCPIYNGRTSSVTHQVTVILWH